MQEVYLLEILVVVVTVEADQAKVAAVVDSQDFSSDQFLKIML